MVGGHRALDLVNTSEPRLPVAGRHEHLASPADLLIWVQRAELTDAAEADDIADAWNSAAAAAETALTTVRQIREALATTLTATLDPGTPASDTNLALEYLSLRWGAAVARAALVLDRPAGAGARLVTGSAPASLIQDRVAFAAVELLTQVDLRPLGICPPEAGGCGWMFLDRSRNGSRRWCDMGCCGTYAKARRLTARRRGARK